MKVDRLRNVGNPGVNAMSIVSKKDKGTPERGTPRPSRPDRGGGHPGRPDRAFEDGLPGDVIVPPRNDMPGEIIVPDRDERNK